MDYKSKYLAITEECRKIFTDKNEKYGDSWKMFRQHSLLDQIFIKAMRAKIVSSTGIQLVKDEYLYDTYLSIFNYSFLFDTYHLVRSDFERAHSTNTEATPQYHDKFSQICYSGFCKKDHDYGSVWLQMDKKSFPDFILVKLRRIRNMISEKEIDYAAIASNIRDVANYALLAALREEVKS